MIDKYFDDIETFEEINGHFNKNFKVKTNKGLFHLKVLKNGKSEISKWIQGETIKEWDINSLRILDKEISTLKGSAEVMDLLDLNITDKKYLSLVDKYKNVPKVYCHNDINKDNVILDGNKITIIDFEFARMNHPYWEYANIVVEDNLEIDLLLEALPKLDKQTLSNWIYINRTYTDAWKLKQENK